MHLQGKPIVAPCGLFCPKCAFTLMRAHQRICKQEVNLIALIQQACALIRFPTTSLVLFTLRLEPQKFVTMYVIVMLALLSNIFAITYAIKARQLL